MFGEAQRGDRVEEMRVGRRLADRPPRGVDPGRPFADRPRERLLDPRRFVGRFIRRVDQDEAAPFLGRQVGVERDVAVGSDDAEAAVVAERRDELLAFLRVRLAERDRSCGRISAWAIAGEPG